MYPNYNIHVEDTFIVKEVQALNIETNEIIEADSVIEMSRKINRKVGTIRNSLQTRNSKISQGYIYRYKTDESWIKPENNISTPKCILVTDINSNEVKIFPSLRNLAKHFNVDRSVIIKRLRDGSNYRNYTFKEMR